MLRNSLNGGELSLIELLQCKCASEASDASEA